MALDDVHQLQLNMTYAGQRLMNTLSFRVKSTTAVSQALCQSLADDWKDFFKGSQVSTLSYTSWVVQQLRGGTVSYSTNPCLRTGGTRFEGTFTAPVIGAVTGDGMPPQAAIVTTLKTGLAGRRRRGRNYLPGWDEALQSAGTVAAGTVTAYQAIWNTKLGIYGVGGSGIQWELGIWSNRVATGCIPSETRPFSMHTHDNPDPIAAYTGVTTAVVRSIVYSQRRRTIGVGR